MFVRPRGMNASLVTHPQTHQMASNENGAFESANLIADEIKNLMHSDSSIRRAAAEAFSEFVEQRMYQSEPEWRR
jgi:hypothetical protein